MAVNEETLRLTIEAIGSEKAAQDVEQLGRALQGIGAARTAATNALQDATKVAIQLSASLKGIPDQKRIGLSLDPNFVTRVKEAQSLIERLQQGKRIDIKATTNITQSLNAIKSDLERVGALKKIEGTLDIKAGPELRALARGGGALADVRNQLKAVTNQIEQQGSRATGNVFQRAIAGIKGQFAGAAQAFQQFAQQTNGAGAFGGLSRGANEAQNAIGGVGAALGNLGQGGALAGVVRISLAIAGIGIAAGVALQALRGVGTALAAPIREAAAQEAANIKLGFALRGIGKYSEESQRALQSYAQTLQQTRGVTDDAVLGVQTLLIQVGRLSGGQLNEATNATLDLAAALGTDLSSAAFLVAKAAAGSTEALGRYGLRIDESIPESQKFAAVLDLIRTKFAGAAEANTRGFTGSLNRARISMGELAEEIGKPALGPLAALFNAAAQATDRFTAQLAKLNAADTETLVQGIERVAKKYAEAGEAGERAAKRQQEAAQKFSADFKSRIKLQVETGELSESRRLIEALGDAARRAAAAGNQAFAELFKQLRQDAENGLNVRLQADGRSLAQLIQTLQTAPPVELKADVKADLAELKAAEEQIRAFVAKVPQARLTVTTDVDVARDVQAAVQSATRQTVTVPATLTPLVIPTTVAPPAPEATAAAVAAAQKQADQNPVRITVIARIAKFGQDRANTLFENLKGTVTGIAGGYANAWNTAMENLGLQLPAPRFEPLSQAELDRVWEIVQQQVAKAPSAEIPLKLNLKALSDEQVDAIITSAREKLAKIGPITPKTDPADVQAAQVLTAALAAANTERNKRIDRKVEIKGIEQVDQMRQALQALETAGKGATIQPIRPEDLRTSASFAEALSRTRAELEALASDPNVPGTKLAAGFAQALQALSALGQKEPALRAQIAAFQAIVMRDLAPTINLKVEDEQARTQVQNFRNVLKSITGVTATFEVQGLGDALTGIGQAAGDLERLPAAVNQALATGSIDAYKAAIAGLSAAWALLEQDANAFGPAQQQALTDATSAAADARAGFEALAKAQDKAREIKLLVDLGRFPEAQARLREFLALVAKAPKSLEVDLLVQQTTAGAQGPTAREKRQVDLVLAIANRERALGTIEEIKKAAGAKPLSIRAQINVKRAAAEAEQAGKIMLASMQQILVDEAKTGMAQAVGGLVTDVLAAPINAWMDKTRTVFDVLADSGKAFVSKLVAELTRLAAFKFLSFLFPGAGAAGGFLARAFGFATTPAATPTSKARPVPPAPTPVPVPAKAATPPVTPSVIPPRAAARPAPAAPPAVRRPISLAIPPASPAARPTPPRQPAARPAAAAPIPRPAAKPERLEQQVVQIPEPRIEAPETPVVAIGIRIGDLPNQTLPAPRVRFAPSPTVTLPALRLRTPRITVAPPAAIKLPGPTVAARTTAPARPAPGPLPSAARTRPVASAAPAPTQRTPQRAIAAPARPVQQPRPLRGPALVNPVPQAKASRPAAPVLSIQVPPARAPRQAPAAAAPAPRAPRPAPAAPAPQPQPRPARALAPIVALPVQRPRPATPAPAAPVDPLPARELAAAARRLRAADQARPAIIRQQPSLAATAQFAREQARIITAGREQQSRGFVPASRLLGDFLPRPRGETVTQVNNIRAIDTRGVRSSLAYGELGRAMKQQARRRG